MYPKEVLLTHIVTAIPWEQYLGCDGQAAGWAPAPSMHIMHMVCYRRSQGVCRFRVITLVRRDYAPADPGVEVLRLQDDLDPLDGRHSRLGYGTSDPSRHQVCYKLHGWGFRRHPFLLVWNHEPLMFSATTSDTFALLAIIAGASKRYAVTDNSLHKMQMNAKAATTAEGRRKHGAA